LKNNFTVVLKIKICNIYK